MGRILWLASFPKSGNTWMRAFLHNLIHDRGGSLDVNAISATALLDAGKRYYTPFTDKDPGELSREEVAALRPKVQAAMARSSSGTVFVKTHTTLTMLAGYPSHDPDLMAGAVYMVRDPRDVAVSYADHLGITLDAAIAAMGQENGQTDATDKGVTEFIGSWSQNVTSWVSQEGPTVLVVRYEDMLATPKTTFGRVVKFLHLQRTPHMVRKAIENTRFDKLARQETKTGFGERSPKQEKFFRRGRSGGWRAILSEAQVQQIEQDHGALMRHFGYLGEQST
ncbi:MAG: sulfotransferase [Rhodospirillaceae bacterium]|nr:sulfotransferase [Rhodospirillaceae bacterium]|tara:strand:- start:2114 stop:2953 length:840 start_codon:yes stop_codon:yes gene_type:complete